jgi:hypothetical protein
MADLSAMAGIIGIGTAGNVGMYSADTDTWADLGLLGGWPLAALTLDPQGNLLGIGQDGGMDWWDFGKGGWTNDHSSGGIFYSGPENWGGIVQYLWGPNVQWVVSPQGSIAKADASTNDSFVDQGAMGGWTVKMLSYDQFNILWCVGTAGNVGQWLENDTWSDYTAEVGGWSFRFFAFDPHGGQWSIGTDGNVGDFPGEDITDLGLVGGWTMRWLFWPTPGMFPLKQG